MNIRLAMVFCVNQNVILIDNDKDVKLLGKNFIDIMLEAS